MAFARQIGHGPRRAAVLLAFGALSACSYAYVTPDFTTAAKNMDPATFECCADPEKFYPPGLTELALTLGNALGPTASQLVYGDYEESEYPGLLTGKTAAHADIVRRLDPFDILLISNHSYQIGRLMPGRFSHSLVYIGTEGELRAAGLWSHPALVPYRDDIRAGKTLMEAAWPDVHLIEPHKAFETDQVLLMRPRLSASEKRAAFARMFSVMGKPFNFTLGIDPTAESFACTGLVDYGMPELGFTHREVYGQTVVMPDDVAAQAVRDDKLDFIAYVAGTEDGYKLRSEYALMVELAAYWGVPGQE
ncbi:hypothetical protein [Sinisalibacter aestuarii]|uniref:Lipoprotein n=1 Tax=Sinisalibacter aestuarii TaxID=2949426 RepID=A0ABQ5LSV6_9RHOB|nr:hypothetical protein [Sinisalibacter aestuarii]GKY88079.1 hypothetical protein STA1M1_19480 [Sinisalibacter aestuarii]